MKPTPNAVPMAMQHLGAGRVDEAERLCRDLLAKTPDDAGALHALGLVFYLRKDYEQAIAQLQRAVQIERDNPQFLANLAEALRRGKRPQEAFEAFDRAATLMPEHLKAHLGAANSLRDLGRIQEAIARFRLALAIDSAFPEAYHYLALTFIDQNRVREAVGLLRKTVALRPTYTDAELALAHALDATGETEEAVTVYRRILERDPKNVAALNNVANMLKALGRFDEAIGYYREALAITPEHTMAYYNLSRAAAAKPDDKAEMARMLELLDDPKLAKVERMNLHYALGKLFDDLGGGEEAFAQYAKAKELDDRGEPFDADAHSALIDRMIDVFSAEFFSRRKGYGSESDFPIFIVGMPRSGTTLVEQILSAHPKVYGAGELDKIGQIVAVLTKKYEGIAAYPECARSLDAINAIGLAESYVDEVRAKTGGAAHATDKMPFNFLHLGFIALLFPRARVIHCARDAMDNCLSCYFQFFTNAMPFTKNLHSLGRYHNDYRRLMAHWKSVLPLRMTEVPYEKMVADQEGMSRRLVEFCGLEWDSACLAFFDAERTVKTASAWQVRQPIYQTSVGRSQPYEKALGPLRELLDAAGYSPPSSEPAAARTGRGRAKSERKLNAISDKPA